MKIIPEHCIPVKYGGTSTVSGPTFSFSALLYICVCFMTLLLVGLEEELTKDEGTIWAITNGNCTSELRLRPFS